MLLLSYRELRVRPQRRSVVRTRAGGVFLVGDVAAPGHWAAGVVVLLHGDVDHEAVRCGTVAVVLAWFEGLLCVSARCGEFAPRAVREALTECSALGPFLADAMLVASELATNAIHHSLCREDEFLTVSLGRDGSLRMSVRDPGRSGGGARVVDRPLGSVAMV